MENQVKKLDVAGRLEKLGLHKANKKLLAATKMEMAYGKYLFVTLTKIQEFNAKLAKETIEENKYAYQMKNLVFIPLKEYGEVPPEHVLTALEDAQQDGCFNTFEVAKIEWIEKIKDPILFGVIEGCTDRFFISQWDDDVKIEDLLFMDK